MTSSKWPHRQPVDARNWRTYWHRRAVGACGGVKTSWFHVGRALAWGKACGGSHLCFITWYRFTRPFGNGLHSIPLLMTAGPCPSMLPEVLSSVYCPKSKCAVARHGSPRGRILASFLHKRCASVTHASMDAQAHPWGGGMFCAIAEERIRGDYATKCRELTVTDIYIYIYIQRRDDDASRLLASPYGSAIIINFGENACMCTLLDCSL